MTWVKLCGMRTEDDVAAAQAAGADAIGLVFTPSSRQVDLPTAQRLARAAGGLFVVGVFHAPPAGLVEEACAAVDLDAVQLPGSDLAPRPLLPVVVDGPDLGERVVAALRHAGTGRVIVDSAARGGTGVPTDWERIAALGGGDHLVLAGGLTPGNVAEAIASTGVGGVDVSSGIEDHHGRKDPARMTAFVAAARSVEVSP